MSPGPVRDMRLYARVQDCERRLDKVNKILDVLMPDLLWAIIALAKITNTDPPSEAT